MEEGPGVGLQDHAAAVQPPSEHQVHRQRGADLVMDRTGCQLTRRRSQESGRHRRRRRRRGGNTRPVTHSTPDFVEEKKKTQVEFSESETWTLVAALQCWPEGESSMIEYIKIQQKYGKVLKENEAINQNLINLRLLFTSVLTEHSVLSQSLSVSLRLHLYMLIMPRHIPTGSRVVFQG